MAKINFLTGTLVKEVVISQVNGEISVVKSLAFGTSITVGNLTQSGGILKNIWSKTIKKARKLIGRNVQTVLILGLGGGSVAEVVRKTWPDSKITGVDLDPEMVAMGKKYLGLEKLNIDVVIDDALSFLEENIKKKTGFDLVCIDLYIGDQFPSEFEGYEFIRSVNKVLNKGGSAIFNRLYYDEKRKQAMIFGENLQNNFSEVIPIFPEANVMFFCKK